MAKHTEEIDTRLASIVESFAESVCTQLHAAGSTAHDMHSIQTTAQGVLQSLCSSHKALLGQAGIPVHFKACRCNKALSNLAHTTYSSAV